MATWICFNTDAGNVLLSEPMLTQTISKVQWHPHEDIFSGGTSAINLQINLKLRKVSFKSSRGHCVKRQLATTPSDKQIGAFLQQ